MTTIDAFDLAEMLASKVGALPYGGGWTNGSCPLPHDVSSARLDIDVTAGEVLCRCSAGCDSRAVVEHFVPDWQPDDDGDPGPQPPPEEERSLAPSSAVVSEDAPAASERWGDCPIELPPGVVLWAGGDQPRDERPRTTDGPAFDTWVGGVVDSLAPFTEADPIGLLVTLLTYAGAAIGGGPHVYMGNVRHPGRLHAILIGATSRARKGTADAVIAPLIERADPEFFRGQIKGGFGSGESVVDAVRDPDDSGNGGSKDKRLLVREPEFTKLLKVANRQGSTLSEIQREAWDGGVLQVRSRALVSVATGAHVCMIGHATTEGLRRHLNDEDMANGFANRMLYVGVGRAQVLPHGGEVPSSLEGRIGSDLAELIAAGRKRGRMTFTDDASAAWEAFYRRCAADDGYGIVGALTARAEPQVARLALLFSLLDPDAEAIEVGHLAAAEAVWGHSDATVRWVFGDREGDPDADRLLMAIRAHGAHGMTSTEQSELFGRHKTAADLTRMRDRLERRRLIVTGTVPTAGRPQVLSVAVEAKS